MNIKNIFVLIELDNGKIYQARLTQTQELCVKGVLLASGESIKLLDKPISTIKTP